MSRSASATPFHRCFFVRCLRDLGITLDVRRRLEEHRTQRKDLAVAIMWLVDELLDEGSESLCIVACAFWRAAEPNEMQRLPTCPRSPRLASQVTM